MKGRTKTVAVGAALVSTLAACASLLGIGDLPGLVDGGETDARADGGGDAGAESSADAGPAEAAADALVDGGPDCSDAGGNDPLNCGECGRSCHAEACVAGMCQVVELAAGCNGPIHPIVDAQNVYWANSGGSGNPSGSCVLQANKHDGTGQIPLISVVYPHGLALSGSTIFATRLYANNPPLFQGTVNVNSVGSGYASGGTWGFAVAADQSDVYWTAADGFVRSNSIASPTTPTTIASGETTYPGDPENLQDIALDGQWVYWVDTQGGKIRKAPKSGADGGAITVATANNPTSIAVDGKWIYWTAKLGNAIGRAPVSGDGGATQLVTGIGAPLALVVDATHVYWVNAAGEVWRARLDGTVKLKLASGFTQLYDLAVDDEDVFFTEIGGGQLPDGGFPGRVLRVAK